MSDPTPDAPTLNTIGDRVLAALLLLAFSAGCAWLLLEFFTTADPICVGCPGY